MDKLKTIIEDERPIMALHTEGESFFVDKKITAIVPYHENGEMAPVVWFAIYMNEKILNRVNSKFVTTVRYDFL